MGLETISMKQTRLDSESNRALALLAKSPDGCTRAIMLGHGFPLALTASLIRAGVAIDHVNRSRNGRGAVAHVRITDAGLSALAQHERHNSSGTRETNTLPPSRPRLLAVRTSRTR